MEKSTEDYELMMPVARRARIRRQRDTSQSLQSSVASYAESEMSLFLEEKILQVHSEIDLVAAYIEGFDDLKEMNDVDPDHLQAARENKLSECRLLTRELEALKLSQRGLAADMRETITNSRARFEDDPVWTTLEKAYREVVVQRTMACTAKPKKSSFNQSAFRTAVLERYGAYNPTDETVWCHLLGWFPSKEVKAAHLVPKSFTSEELKPLFGSDEGAAFKDPRNGITLHKNIEQALDSGVIIIVPVPTESDQGETRWQCLLVDKERRNQEVCRWALPQTKEQQQDPNKTLEWNIQKWEELDGKHLSFRTPNRPAKRFLYFRFIVSYLYARVHKKTDFLEKIAAHTTFWGSPGEYVERGTLTAMFKKVSGSELPRSLYHNTTFEPNEETSSSETNTDRMMVAASFSDRMRQMRIGQRDEDDDGDGEDDKDEEDD